MKRKKQSRRSSQRNKERNEASLESGGREAENTSRCPCRSRQRGGGEVEVEGEGRKERLLATATAAITDESRVAQHPNVHERAPSGLAAYVTGAQGPRPGLSIPGCALVRRASSSWLRPQISRSATPAFPRCLSVYQSQMSRMASVRCSNRLHGSPFRVAALAGPGARTPCDSAPIVRLSRPLQKSGSRVAEQGSQRSRFIQYSSTQDGLEMDPFETPCKRD